MCRRAPPLTAGQHGLIIPAAAAGDITQTWHTPLRAWASREGPGRARQEEREVGRLRIGSLPGPTCFARSSALGGARRSAPPDPQSPEKPLGRPAYRRFNGNATHRDGDATGDGFVNGADFLFWQQEFGTGVGEDAAGDTAPASRPALATAGHHLKALVRRPLRRIRAMDRVLA